MDMENRVLEMEKIDFLRKMLLKVTEMETKHSQDTEIKTNIATFQFS